MRGSTKGKQAFSEMWAARKRGEIVEKRQRQVKVNSREEWKGADVSQEKLEDRSKEAGERFLVGKT